MNANQLVKKEIIHRAKLYSKCAGLEEITCVFCVSISNNLCERILRNDRELLENKTKELTKTNDLEYRKIEAGKIFFGYDKDKAIELDSQISYRI